MDDLDPGIIQQAGCRRGEGVLLLAFVEAANPFHVVVSPVLSPSLNPAGMPVVGVVSPPKRSPVTRLGGKSGR